MRRASLSRWSRSSQSQTSRDFRFQARPTNSATVARSSVWAFRSRRGILLSAASAADVVPTRPRTPVAGRATDVATEISPERNSRRPTKDSARTGNPLRIDFVHALVSEGLSLEQGLDANVEAARHGENDNALQATGRASG